MKARRHRALLLVAALAVVPVAVAAEGAGVELADAGTGAFPDRAYVLTLPTKKAIDSDDVTVTEDGKRVDAVVATAGAEGGIGTVLLIDASNSMSDSIDEAMKAARTFADRTEGQALSVVTFNSKPTVALPFTNDQKAIATALSKPPTLAEGTRIYDALAAAAAQIRDANLGAGRVVLLSDGADIGSVTSAESAIGQLEAEGVRAYTVGIASPDFTDEQLKQIATETGGTYAEASTPTALEPIFDELGVKAANEYVLRYRSDARPGEKVEVEAAVAGFGAPATLVYTTPEPGTGGPYEPSFWDRLIQSWPMVLLVIGAVVGLLYFAVRELLRLRSNRALRQRMGGFVSMDDEARAAERRREVDSYLAAGAESPWRRLGWFQEYEQDVDVGRLGHSVSTFFVWSVIGGLLVALVLGVLFTPFLALAGIAVPFIVRAEVARRAEAERKQFQEQLDENLEVLGSALRAGHSLAGAMNVVVDEAQEPSASEFRRVVTDEQLGVPLDEALEVTARRMHNRDVEQVAVVAMLQREAGGNMAEVLDRVIENIRAREDIRRLVRVLTAQGRLARWIVTLIPVVMAIGIAMIAPGHLQPLFHETVGQIFLIIGVILVIAGSLVIKRIVAIEL